MEQQTRNENEEILKIDNANGYNNDAKNVVGDDYPLYRHQIANDQITTTNNSSNNITSNYFNNNEDTMNKLISRQRQSAESYMYETKAKLLGICFLKNERKGFEQQVERSMHQLLAYQHQIMIENDQKQQQQKPLPYIQISIPNTINDYVKIQIIADDLSNQRDFDYVEQLFCSIKQYNQEFFENFQNDQQQKYFRDSLVVNPIKILVNQLFLYRGQLNTSVEKCLTMTTIFSSLSLPQQHSNNDNASNSSSNIQQHNRYQQCLVVHFESSAQVTEILNVFRKLHGIVNHFQPSSLVSRVNEYKVVINAEVEIQEEVTEGKWQNSPREKDSFKLRTNIDKRIIINLQQDLTHYNYPIVQIERCFGMLLSPGRNVSSNQMVAIGLNSMNTSIPNPETAPNQAQWQIVANWIPSEIDFDYLNTETPRNTRVYFTIALDLILENVEEPIRFVFESKAKIIPASISATEKLWKNFTNLSKNSQRFMQECFSIIVRQRSNMSGCILYEVVSCLSSTQISMQKQRLSLQLNLNKIAAHESSNGSPTPSSPILEDQNNDGDDDEPLQSGSGLVNKECSQNEFQAWHTLIEKWNQENLSVRPRQLAIYIRRCGIPQTLRPEVWQMLSRAHEIKDKILPKYKLLVTQESPYESIIMRDISRTFTAHEKFRDAGPEQESLFRICKAYSNYDAEIGYCQGLSYLVAALLLNIPEEQTFCVLVQIMYHYGLRDLFKSGLENLHCKFYQLERLLDEQIPELYFHFMDLHIEAHMYASQWFLTLFTTKFPLNVIFMIIDLFLLDEMDVILQIALGLLQMSKNDLLALDFEGIMKYFRVTLPKRYRNDDAARELIRRSIKINVKKSKKYEAQYQEWREKNRDPLEILQTENKRLMQTVARLEQENDDQAQELLGLCQSKIKMKTEVDRAEDKAETLNSLLLQTRTRLVDSEEDRKQLTEELKNLKDKYRKEIERFEFEKQNDRKIIEEYKQICKNYQEKYDVGQKESCVRIEKILEQLKSCQECSDQVHQILSLEKNGADFQISNHKDPEKHDLYKRIEDLEAELIKTKIALAESEDRNGQLVGKLHTTNSELNLLKAQNDERAAIAQNTWFAKTLSSIRDAATSSSYMKQVKPSNSVSFGISSAESNNNYQHHDNSSEQNKFRRNSSQYQ